MRRRRASIKRRAECVVFAALVLAVQLVIAAGVIDALTALADCRWQAEPWSYSDAPPKD